MIELNKNNLYRNGKVVALQDGGQLLVRDKVTFEGTLTDNYHVLRKTDRLDLLAYRYYQDFAEDSSKYWWVIADANDIQNPLDLEEYVGQELLIPNLSKALIRL